MLVNRRSGFSFALRKTKVGFAVNLKSEFQYVLGLGLCRVGAGGEGSRSQG